MKRIAVNKADAAARIAEITKNMARANWFINVSTMPHKDSSKIWIVIG